jgi:Zn finger protein HypA/HybF involved in hydrogenase expression
MTMHGRKREHENLSFSITIADLRADSIADLMADLPPNRDLTPNRIRCSDCKAFRSITDFPFKDGFHRHTCMKCKVRRTQIQEHRRIKRQEANKERLSFIGSSIFYLCSSCTQQRPNTDFGRFSTCSSCRSTNKKSAQRRKETIKPRYRAPTLQEIKEHLQEWVVGDGEHTGLSCVCGIGGIDFSLPVPRSYYNLPFYGDPNAFCGSKLGSPDN